MAASARFPRLDGISCPGQAKVAAMRQAVVKREYILNEWITKRLDEEDFEAVL